MSSRGGKLALFSAAVLLNMVALVIASSTIYLSAEGADIRSAGAKRRRTAGLLAGVLGTLLILWYAVQKRDPKAELYVAAAIGFASIGFSVAARIERNKGDDTHANIFASMAITIRIISLVTFVLSAGPVIYQLYFSK